MRSTRHLLLVLPLVLALAGCGGGADPTSPAALALDDDQAIAMAEVDRHPEALDDGAGDSEERTEVEGSAGSTVALPDAVRPFHFWRTITSVERRFEIAFADTDTTGRPTTAVVTLHRRLRGTFNILRPAPGDTAREVVRKRLADHWVKRFKLVRVSHVRGERRPWRIVAVSGVEITSRDAATRIESLRIQSGDLDTTLVDPLAFHRLRRVLRFDAGAKVRLTVTTGVANDVVVLHHRGRRFRFQAQGDGTHVGEWEVPALAGLRHLGVNALSNGTLFDNQAPYDSKTWVFPFVVRPTELAEEMP